MGNSIKFIMVDDDYIYLNLLRKQLERAGVHHCINHFSTAGDFLTYFCENQDRTEISSALLILDLHLPFMSGIDLLAQLQCMPELANTGLSTIVNTTSSNPDDRSKCQELGCMMYHVKTPDNKELICAIKSHLQQHVLLS